MCVSLCDVHRWTYVCGVSACVMCADARIYIYNVCVCGVCVVCIYLDNV